MGKYEPQGMIFDAQQRLFVAMKSSGLINVISGVDQAKPKIFRQYQAGGEDVTNCHFNNGYLYTSIKSKEAVFRLKLNVSGYPYTLNPDLTN